MKRHFRMLLLLSGFVSICGCGASVKGNKVNLDKNTVDMDKNTVDIDKYTVPLKGNEVKIIDE